MEEENGSGYNDNSDVGCLFWINVLFNDQTTEEKEEELKQMMETLEVGDSVLTTSGFYGVVVDKVDETTIIVEFGNDKHCRIPMEKSAIQAMEKANASSSEE
jgi:protein translocase subunit yajC